MITLLGEPRSTQHIYKSHCRFGFPSVYMSKEGKALKESYQWQVKSQWHKPILTGPLEVSFDLYFGRKGKHDIDNFSKILLDSLTNIVWEDDDQIMKAIITKGYDKNNPRVEITINEN